MRNSRFFTSFMILSASLLVSLADLAYGQLWRQFAHPNNPHDVYITVPQLFNNTNAVVQLPVLLVLLDFDDLAADPAHTPAYFADMVFGMNRANGRPSVAETYRENSNGRLLLVPATAGDNHGAKDGIVGWVTAQTQVGCCKDLNGDPVNLSQNACQQQGFTWTSGTFAYYTCYIAQKRAEGIRQADLFFNYSLYDSNGDKVITSDELVVIVVNAHNVFGGNARHTDPRKVPVDGGNYQVDQLVTGVTEAAHVGLIAHEIGHQAFALRDLYERSGCTRVADGYECNGDWHPPDPARYSLMGGNNPSSFLSHLDPWAKIHLGFVKPLVITHDGTYTLYDMETERSFSTQDSQPEAIIIYDPLRPDPYKEYFILENRDRENRSLFDNSLVLDRGLAVWLIDEDVSTWPNRLNLRKSIRLIRRASPWAGELESLWDGVNDTDGYDITATSSPRNTNWADGTSSYIEIYDISPAGPAMTFKVRMTPIFVDRANSGFENGTQTNPFNTVIEGVNAVPEPPRTIKIAGGSYPETLVINTPVTLKGWRNGNAVIGK